MTAPSYLASLNERQQVTFPIGGPGQPAAVDPGTIASAIWRMQVRSSATANGTLLLDSQVGGTWAYVGGAAPAVTFQWPTSAAAMIPPGSAAFDVLFIFPGADAELATAGSVAFTHGVTQAGVSGSRAAPIGADDTWTLVGAPGTPTSPSLASAVASANSSAAAAATSQTAAGASATATAGSATSASGSAATATTEAAAAATSAGNASASAATATTAASAAAASATASAASAATATTEAAAAATSATAAALAVRAAVATSVTGLAALNPSFKTAILTQSGRFGQFNWVGGNLETQVANDPGQGIYVAWSDDSAPGATGAWVRQWNRSVDWAWWGAVPDGAVTQDINWNTTASSGTNNMPMLTNWQIWARYQSSLGIGVYVEPSPGIYCWNQAAVNAPAPGGLYWTSDISKLHINGRGVVTLQNLTAAGEPFPIPSIALLTPYLIEQTTPGTASFTCITPSQASNFTTGQWMMLGSIDTQFLGYPPNLQQYEYGQVSAPGNTSTGVVTLQSPVKYQNRTDYPDYNAGGSGNACGAARAWVIGAGYGTNWDIDHTYEGLQVNLPPSASQHYCTLTGRNIKTKNWIGCGFSETVAGTVVHDAPVMKTAGEPDKLVEYIEYNDPDFRDVGLGFQSCSPRSLVIKGGNVGGIAGCCQRLYAVGTDFNGPFGLGCEYGLNYSTIFESCRFNANSSLYFGGVLDGAQLQTIDGTNVSYANGTLSLNSSLLGYGIALWNSVPGMVVALQAEGSDGTALFPTDVGVGIVLSASYNSGTGILSIKTSLPFATLPSWATGKIWFFKCGPVTMRDCTGVDVVRLASDAAAAGQRYFEYYRQIFTGVYGQSLEMYPNGVLESVQCNVITPGSVSSATLTLQFYTYNTASNFVADSPGYTQVVFNIGVAGNRLLTTNSFVGKAGTDAVLVTGSPTSYLPTNRTTWVCVGTINTEPASNVAAPLFELTIVTYCGIARKIVTAELFGGRIGTVLPVQGILQ